MGSSSSRPQTRTRPATRPNDPSGFTVVNGGHQPPAVYNSGVQYAPQQQQAPAQYPQQPRPPAPAEKKKTKTIRNDVNLKKHTLKLVQDESDPSVYYPTFTFDCGSPCSVTVFFMATESPSEKLRLRTSLQSPGRRVQYEKKLGCVFPPEDMDPSEYKQYGIVPALYADSQLSSAEANEDSGEHRWPICIRLECVVAEEALEDHKLGDLPAGCGMRDWIQSQTTYACLERHETTWSVKVLKQKIWVQNLAYELQEIYGLENAGTPVAEGPGQPSDDLGRECVICMSEPRDTTLLPCRHMCLCHECAQMLRQQTNKCPICRTPVRSLLEITLKT